MGNCIGCVCLGIQVLVGVYNVLIHGIRYSYILYTVSLVVVYFRS